MILTELPSWFFSTHLLNNKKNRRLFLLSQKIADQKMPGPRTVEVTLWSMADALARVIAFMTACPVFVAMMPATCVLQTPQLVQLLPL